jgi:hypothetical protein
MTDFDIDRLGDLWRQRPSPEELETLRRTAEAVQRRARWAQVIDVGAAVVVALVVLVMVLASPAIETMLIGGAAILVLLVGQIRQRKFRAIELRALTGGTEDMIEQSIERVEAGLKRARFGLLGLGPALLLGWFLALTVDDRAGSRVQDALTNANEYGLVLILFGTLLLLGTGLQIGRIFRANRKERDRLMELREAYRKERESTSSGSPE